MGNFGYKFALKGQVALLSQRGRAKPIYPSNQYHMAGNNILKPSLLPHRIRKKSQYLARTREYVRPNNFFYSIFPAKYLIKYFSITTQVSRPVLWTRLWLQISLVNSLRITVTTTNLPGNCPACCLRPRTECTQLSTSRRCGAS